LRPHDVRFSTRSEERVLADTSQPIGDLRSQYRAAVEYDHPVRGIDVRLNPIVRQDGNYVYRRRAGGEINLNLYALTRAIDEQATKPVPSAFTQDGDQTILELRMNVRTGFEQLLPGEGLIDRLSEIVGNVEKIFRNNVVVYKYARDFVGELRTQEIPFYAFSNQQAFFIANLLSENRPEGGWLSTSFLQSSYAKNP
jgi:hypothetical protein